MIADWTAGPVTPSRPPPARGRSTDGATATLSPTDIQSGASHPVEAVAPPASWSGCGPRRAAPGGQRGKGPSYQSSIRERTWLSSTRLIRVW